MLPERMLLSIARHCCRCDQSRMSCSCVTKKGSFSISISACEKPCCAARHSHKRLPKKRVERALPPFIVTQKSKTNSAFDACLCFWVFPALDTFQGAGQFVRPVNRHPLSACYRLTFLNPSVLLSCILTAPLSPNPACIAFR